MTDNSTQKSKEGQIMYSHFVDGLISGRFRKLSEIQVKEIVMRNHFGFIPITPLTGKEEELLLALALKDLYSKLNHEYLEGLCGQVFYNGETFFINGGKKDDLRTKDQPLLLSPDQKINLLFDPKI